MEKDTSLKITNSPYPGKTMADLRLYNPDLTPVDFNQYPKMVVTMAENEEKYQYGYVKLDIFKDKDTKESYFFHVDGLMSIVYNTYARSLNDLRRPTFKMQAVRFHSFLTRLFHRLFD